MATNAMLRGGNPSILEAVLTDARYPEMYKQIFSTLHTEGPMTGLEVERASSVPNAHTFLSKMLRLGLLKKRGQRRCRVTGKRAYEWAAVSEYLPPFEPQAVSPPVFVPTAADVSAFLDQTREILTKLSSVSESKVQVTPKFKAVFGWLQELSNPSNPLLRNLKSGSKNVVEK